MVLDVQNVSVKYLRDEYKNMRFERRLMAELKREKLEKEYYSVKDVSFTLDEGEIVGIIGRNGSGKSSVLKAIAGTMPLANGKIKAYKSVSALLELGTGFDINMTVRENIYIRAALLGYSREFLESKYDEILDFADLKPYEEYSYKSLSSGMRSRMAFAIVSVMQPEILLLDEVFAVGDADFQRKSGAKMRELISQGASTLLVSHSQPHIKSLCSRVIWMDKGTLMMDGKVNEVFPEYNKFLSSVGKNKNR